MTDFIIRLNSNLSSITQRSPSLLGLQVFCMNVRGKYFEELKNQRIQELINWISTRKFSSPY